MIKEELLLDVEAARRFCRQIFEAVGIPDADAAIVTDNLLEADLRGLSSHGISRVLVYCDRIRNGWVNKRPNIRIVNESTGLLHVDGDNGLGAVVGRRAMGMCIDRATDTGVAICSVRKGNHFGIASFYTLQAVERDMIGVAASNNPPNMAPWGGVKPMIGTNPFSIGVPAGRHPPFVLDMSSSIVARGKINLAEIEDRPIPEGWAIDRTGRSTTDPTEALAGSVLPFGMHKGYGIALMVDVLCGILSGASFSCHVGQLWGNNESIQDIGLYFSAVDMSRTIGVEEFKRRVDQLIDELKASPTGEGVEEVLVPGEIEFRRARENVDRGIPVGPGVLRDLNGLREDLGIGMKLDEYLSRS